LLQALKTSLSAARGDFYNSLEAPVFEKFPLLAIFRDFFAEHGAAVAMMSGSGSTTFALIEDQQKADRIEEEFKGKFGASFWTCKTALQRRQEG
jgi:4-diphosphocytidyl-2-C-methyl-D-erythritol kinase